MFDFRNWVDWLYLATFAIIAHIATTFMLWNILIHPKNLGSRLPGYIFRGVAITLLLFLPFFVRSAGPLRFAAQAKYHFKTENKKSEIENEGAKLFAQRLAVVAYVIFHM